MGLQDSAGTSLLERFAADFAAGCTVPYLARFERDRTHGISEASLWDAWEQWDAARRLANRRRSLAVELERMGRLDPDLARRIETCTSRRELEDLQRPLRASRRRSKASIAREQGLEALADLLEREENWTAPPENLAKPFCGAGRQTLIPPRRWRARPQFWPSAWHFPETLCGRLRNGCVRKAHWSAMSPPITNRRPGTRCSQPIAKAWRAFLGIACSRSCVVTVKAWSVTTWNFRDAPRCFNSSNPITVPKP